MKKIMTFIPLLAIFSLVSCASAPQPQQTLVTLNMDDPKYNSDGCKNIRNSAIGYDDKVATRAGLGLATGLLLGPVGILPAAIADVSQNNKRDLINQEIGRQCVTIGFISPSAPIKSDALADKKVCNEINGTIKCE